MPKNSLHHHPVALWFADIAGYSTGAAEDERGALQLVEILQALSRKTVQEYEGRVVKFFGDASRSSQDIVLCISWGEPRLVAKSVQP
jgi:class 3 adenylate cyclase